MIFENLNMRPEAQLKGYYDGLSCCNVWGEKTARKLSNLKPVNHYEEGKKQAALDWLMFHKP